LNQVDGMDDDEYLDKVYEVNWYVCVTETEVVVEMVVVEIEVVEVEMVVVVVEMVVMVMVEQKFCFLHQCPLQKPTEW